MARPSEVNDLQVLWAIRDIPATSITYEQRCLLYSLLAIIGNKEACWYSLTQLSVMLGRSKSFLTRSFKSLSQSNFIQIKRPHNQGRGLANEYNLNYSHILSFQKKGSREVRKGSLNPPLPNKKGSSSTPFTEKRVAEEVQKGSSSTPQDIKKERHKDRERESGRAERSPHSVFVPCEDSKMLAKELSVDLNKELAAFIEYNKAYGKKYASIDTAFNIWLKQAKIYQSKNIQRQEVRSTVPEYGPGHPTWEFYHGSESIQ